MMVFPAYRDIRPLIVENRNIEVRVLVLGVEPILKRKHPVERTAEEIWTERILMGTTIQTIDLEEKATEFQSDSDNLSDTGADYSDCDCYYCLQGDKDSYI